MVSCTYDGFYWLFFCIGCCFSFVGSVVRCGSLSVGRCEGVV